MVLSFSFSSSIPARNQGYEENYAADEEDEAGDQEQDVAGRQAFNDEKDGADDENEPAHQMESRLCLLHVGGHGYTSSPNDAPILP